MQSARMNNPLCRPSKLSLTTHFEETGRHQDGDEFCHAHSAHVRRRNQRQKRQRDASHTLTEFVDFLRREDARALPVIGAIAATGTSAAAAESLGITKADFRRLHNRLLRLAQFFLA